MHSITYKLILVYCKEKYIFHMPLSMNRILSYNSNSCLKSPKITSQYSQKDSKKYSTVFNVFFYNLSSNFGCTAFK